VIGGVTKLTFKETDDKGGVHQDGTEGRKESVRFRAC